MRRMRAPSGAGSPRCRPSRASARPSGRRRGARRRTISIASAPGARPARRPRGPRRRRSEARDSRNPSLSSTTSTRIGRGARVGRGRRSGDAHAGASAVWQSSGPSGRRRVRRGGHVVGYAESGVLVIATTTLGPTATVARRCRTAQGRCYPPADVPRPGPPQVRGADRRRGGARPRRRPARRRRGAGTRAPDEDTTGCADHAHDARRAGPPAARASHRLRDRRRRGAPVQPVSGAHAPRR